MTGTNCASSTCLWQLAERSQSSAESKRAFFLCHFDSSQNATLATVYYWPMLRPMLYAQLMGAATQAGGCRRLKLGPQDLKAEVSRIHAATGMAPLSIACDLADGPSRARCLGLRAGPFARSYKYCIEHCPLGFSQAGTLLDRDRSHPKTVVTPATGVK
jgi:hypothetical protein